MFGPSAVGERFRFGDTDGGGRTQSYPPSHWKQSFEEVLRCPALPGQSPLPSWKGRRETQGAGLSTEQGREGAPRKPGGRAGGQAG